MTKSEMITSIKEKLNITNNSRDILIDDIILLSLGYCNIRSSELPDGIEPIIRRKIKTIIDYEIKIEASPLLNSAYEVKSLTEGDSSVTFNVTNDNSRDTIYDLSTTDKRALRKFRRLR